MIAGSLETVFCSHERMGVLMTVEPEIGLTILRIAGFGEGDLYGLANAYRMPLSPNEITSILFSLSYSEEGSGVNGCLYRWDGKDLIQIDIDREIDITGLAYHNNTLYIAAGLNGVFTLEDGGLEPLKKLTLYHLASIGNLLFGVGYNLVARFDGSTWKGGPLNL